MVLDATAVFVGAGLSISARYPSWSALVQSVAKRLNLPESSDLLTLAQFAVNIGRSRNLINQRIVEEFTPPRKPTSTHQRLAELPIRTFWTTNYDNLVETALVAAGQIVDVKRRQQDLPRLIPGRTVTVFKMHGDAEAPEEAVLTRDDYEEYARTRELYVDALTADLLMKTFMFIGVSFTDPNISFLLGRLRAIYHGSGKQHFWIAKRPEGAESGGEWFDYRVEDLKRYGIQTIVVTNWADLDLLFVQIRREYDSERRRKAVFISGSVNGTDPQAEAVRTLARLVTRRLIERGLTIVTGLGHTLGADICAAALDAIYQDSAKSRFRPDQLIARPFPNIEFERSDERQRTRGKRAEHRRRMINEAGIAVFIGGRGGVSSGSRDEYEIAVAQGCYCIPIGASGGEAAELWATSMKNTQGHFGSKWAYVEEAFLQLNQPVLPAEKYVDALDGIITALVD